MKIYPAIDVLDGKVVRLEKGIYSKSKQYSSSPIEVAIDFYKKGAKFLHLVDLSGAKKKEFSLYELIEEILNKTKLKIQTGGGIRNYETVERLVSLGVDKVVIGSLALKDPDLFKRILEDFPSRISLALDVELNQWGEAYVAQSAWTEISNIKADDLLRRYENLGLKQILCTDITRDGMLSGSNINLYQKLKKQFPNLNFLASGGVSSLEEMQDLSIVPLAGAIIGRALYERELDIKEVLDAF